MALTKITGQVINTATDVTVGVLTVTDTLAVGGTVSVGGTLTYEDVTNIDSVGLVTARNGIVVGSGITLSKDGDIFATGVTTSTTFVGNLTGNVTGNISGGTVAGSTGTFTGDVDIASSLVHTGDTDTKLSFSTNTIKFDTNTEERVRITTDGELLVNTTTASPHVRLNQKLGVVQVGNYGGASLTNYGGTAAVNKAILDFNRSRGTSNASMTSVASGDGLAHIVFRGADGTNFIDSAAIRADVDGTPGTNDMPGRLVFETTADGSNSLSERLKIKSDGAVNIPDGGASTGRLSIGTGEDVKLYHDGSQSFLTNATGYLLVSTTGGDLILRSNTNVELQPASGETGVRAIANGSTELYNNNLPRLTTQVAGVDVRNETECFFKIARTNDSPSDGDYVGNLEFLGKDSGNNFTPYGKILSQIIDTTDGTEDGRVIFQSMKEGTLTTAATIEHGYFQNNTAPGYFGDNAQWTSSNPNMHLPSLKWTSGDYVSSTGVFTCPVAGKYLCSATVQAHRANNNSGGSSTYYNVLWQKNNGNYHIEMVGTIATNAGALGISDVNGKHDQITATVIMDCAKGDTIRAHSNHGYRNASQNIVGVILIA